VTAPWRVASALALFVITGGCGAAERVQAAPGSGVDAPKPSAGQFPDDERALLRFRSARFKLTVPLPDGRAWRIDDHTHRELVATHAGTHSTVTAYAFLEPQLVNRQRCEERARELGLVPTAPLQTVEDAVTVGPGAFDTRVWVALEASKEGGPLTGHLLAFGAYIHKCIVFHFASEVSTDRDEPLLSSRLAVARLRIFGGLAVEPFDEPPRDRLP
jgi:hypothetical protein